MSVVAHGYLVYLVRAGVPYRPNELYRLSEVGPDQEDLLEFLSYHLDALGHGYHDLRTVGEGYRVRELDRRGRSLWVRINVGPAGSPGETFDLDTQQSIETTDRQAQLSGLRALFAIPEHSYYGLLFVERHGRRHLKELLLDSAVRPAGTSCRAVMRLEGYAEIDDWRRELSGLQVLRVSESLVRRDIGQDASTLNDTFVTIAAEGGQVHRLGDRFKSIFTGRVERRDERLKALAEISDLGGRRREATNEGVAFLEEEEYAETVRRLAELNPAGEADAEMEAAVDEVVPVDRSNFVHQRFDIALGKNRPTRSIVVESNSLPQFVYELGGRLTDGGLRDAWVTHAERIFKSWGVQVPTTWSANTRTK